MEELIKRLESVDTQESAKAVGRLQKRLGRSREPQLLGELVDYFIASGSPRALRVLSSLKDVQSQDFFAKLNDCMHSKVPLRLPVLRLLAHSLNKQTSWLYKIVQHPLFTSVLHCLKMSHDILVLTSGLLVLAAILPLAPCHLSRHLPDIFQIFADLATVRTTGRLRLMPKPLHLHLDVAVYYLFLQLYALFPCNLFTFLRGRYGPTGETGNFYQFIAPLFNFVRFHPGLVMDSDTIETQGDKWRSMEPDEIATLSLTMCLDLSIACPLQEEEGGDVSSSIAVRPAVPSWEPTTLATEFFSLADQQDDSLPQLTNNLRIFPPQLPNPHTLPPLSDSSAGSGPRHSRHSSCFASGGTPSPVKGVSPRNTRRQQSLVLQSAAGKNGSLRDAPNVDGAVPSGNQMSVVPGKDAMWSPSTMFDSSLSSSRPLGDPSRQHSGISTVHSNIATPSPENSASTSRSGTAHHTPRPMTAPTFTYMNYSPTASLRSEPLSRQNTPSSSRSTTRQSSQQLLDGGDPFVSSSNRLSKSLYVSTTSGRSVEVSRQESVSLRNRFEKFFSLFSRKTSSGDHNGEEEPFTEVSSSDLFVGPSSAGRRGVSEGAGSGEGVRGVDEEVGTEASEELLLGSGEGIYTSPGGESREDGEVEEENEDTIASNESTTTEIPHSVTAEPRLPASFPGDGGRGQGEEGRRGRVGRRRASHSDSVTHTVRQVRERLRELAESQNLENDGGLSQKTSGRGSEGEEEGGEGGKGECEGSTEARQEVGRASFTDAHLVTGPIPTVDSTHTLVGSLSNSSLFSSQRLTDIGKSLDTNEAGETPLPRSSSLRRNSCGGLVMRRVSVCDIKTTLRGICGDTDHTPSPVVLLDQLIQHGEIVHEGRPQDIPLTELEGVDWFRFGGCPHGEELGQMQSQVALLHSQLLFERHQCLQHDRRSRRLLSQARTTHRVREELERLLHQCWQESLVRQCLEQELQEARREAGEGGRRERRERLRDENRALSDKNATLEAENRRLTVELARLQQENQKLNQEAKEMRERVFVLESEQADVQPRLAQNHTLREKVSALERELLVLRGLYQRQREEARSLRARGPARQELTLLTSSLREEKEAVERERDKLGQEAKGLRMMLSSLEEEKRKAQEEKNELQQILQHVQGRCQEKIRASEEKYDAIVAVAHQLESHLTELRACSFATARKRPSPHRHKRSSSHPTVPRSPLAPAAPPSPVTSHTPTSLRTV